MALTDALVRGLKPREKVYRLFDGRGLHIEVRPNGSKLWNFKYRFRGKERRMGFGQYPEVTLKEAREKMEEGRALMRRGLDPAEEKRASRRPQAKRDTVREVTEEWLDRNGRDWTLGYQEDTLRAFALHVFPYIGDTPMDEVTASDVLDVLTRMTASNTRRELARRVRQKLERVWNFAILKGRATTNPAAPVKGELPKPKVRGFAAVTEDDLPGLLVAVRAYGNRLIEYAVLLQVLTATRPGEARKAAWDEFDFRTNTWSIPEDHTKKRRAHTVPLSRQARQVLDALRPLTGGGRLLFPSRSRPDRPMSDGTVNRCLDRMGYLEPTPHGFRKTFSTAANEAGQRGDVVEACLAHKDRDQTRATYNLAEYNEAKRALMQWWGDRVEQLCAEHAAQTNTAPVLPPT